MGHEKTYVFAASGNRRPLNYVDENGNLKGFDLDIANRVCSVAGKKCTFAKLPLGCVTNSAGGKFVPGKALVTGEADGCLSTTITAERELVFDFTRAYYKTTARFHVAPGNPRHFSPEEIQGKKITFLNGTYTNMDCLKRLGLNGAVPVVANGLRDALANVLENRVDALFAPRPVIPGVERVPGEYNCAKGSGVMVLKGNTLPEWWNRAFQRVVESGDYRRICDASPARHGGRPVNCFNYQPGVVG
ncbi:unnamed protein product [Owenia fusiformis]|uniref:Solute-binding protein family 3/N-terminal domain-containing protein n=1 Tax=Owenia fusiformis TaxID=6347 RepID=A0A8S4N458_OWEFU|nr:unnamed protein product [Owenia fusiformis]